MNGTMAGIVFDTNVLLDFWVFEDPRALPLRVALETGRLHAWRSGPCVDELSDVLSRPRFALSNERRCTILRQWDRLAQPCASVGAAPFTCTDPADQKFLDLAHTTQAGWLVTKDRALLKLARRARAGGLQIVEPVAAVTQFTAA